MLYNIFNILIEKNIAVMLKYSVLQINIERARIDSQKVDIVQLVQFFTKKIFDNSIMNTTNEEYKAAKRILQGVDVSIIDAARLIRSILDCKKSATGDLEYCAKVIDAGRRNVRDCEMPLLRGYEIFLESKRHLRPDSLRDIRWIFGRLMRFKPQFASKNFSEFSAGECAEWLGRSFSTAPQHNKARAMLHALFEFALRRDWCGRNPIKCVERRKIVEREIVPLGLYQTRRLVQTAKRAGDDCGVTAALLVYSGIRPREVRRLTWSDIDTDESIITVRSQCSKTGGVRQVEIPPVLGKILGTSHVRAKGEKICPRDWERRWREIRDSSGFRGRWVCDVLRHTYASFHAKHYADLPRLQLNMGHRDLSLLRSRYVNMHGISKADARAFFNSKA